VDYLRVPEERTVQLDNLVEVEVIQQAAEEPLPIGKTPGVFTVVHAGRFHAQKNQELLLNAFARLKNPAQLWMLGEGPLEKSLRAQADRLGISARVRWLGFQKNPYTFFRAADCLALSSDWEGLPNVVIEAMVCGTPVVATRCPFGPEELIDDGQTGLLVETGDVAAFAAALQEMAESGARRQRLGIAARQAASERFASKSFAASYESLFEDVVSAPRRNEVK
jgi:glycosyltransferase involved in cell wall biosynthesis